LKAETDGILFVIIHFIMLMDRLRPMASGIVNPRWVWSQVTCVPQATDYKQLAELQREARSQAE